MHISLRAKNIQESVTLKLNAKAMKLAEEGNRIFNLTAGQLPFRPSVDFVEHIKNEINFLNSFQYSPVPGFPALRKKIIKHIEDTRQIDFQKSGVNVDCIISNGGKHALSVCFETLVEPEDEVILISPYWVSYTEMIKLCGGKPVVVESSIFNNFEPALEDMKAAITNKTRAIVINSPTNPTGTHYRPEWMESFGQLMKEFPNIHIISDEIYYQLYYFDPKPTYFYQYVPELLQRTIIIDGISKTLASTGLRIGYTIAPKDFVAAMGKIQGQTASGANSLIQRALLNFDFNKMEEFLGPVKDHLRANGRILRDQFREANLSSLWYQSVSAFYFMIDFSHSPLMDNYRKGPTDTTDYAVEICDDLLNNWGVALVPSTDFGTPNAARLSLVLEQAPFSEAVSLIIKFLQGTKKS